MRTKNEKRFNFNVQFIAGLNLLKSILNKDKNKEESITFMQMYVNFWGFLFVWAEEQFDFRIHFPEENFPKTFYSWVHKLKILELVNKEKKLAQSFNNLDEKKVCALGILLGEIMKRVFLKF